ncbi:major facilitator superfamily domain-containing protein 4B-like [Aplochiton taeniatus]
MFVDERILTLFKRNFHHTLTYWSVFFSFGLCIAFLGPTILDLQCQTQSTLSQITWVFFSQQFCLLIGSSIAGVFKKTLFRALSALFVSALVISIIFAIIPFCHNVLLLAVAMAVSGLAMGIIDTIANIQLVSLYQRDSAVFLQALHFFIGFGALVSPLIADPFLSEKGCGNSTGNDTEMLHHFRYMMRNSPIATHNISHVLDPVPLHEEEESPVSYAFWIMALINLPVPCAVLFLMYREQLIPCFPSGTPRLLDKDELAMETQQGAEGPGSEPKDHEGGGGHGDIFSCCQNDNLRGLPVSFFMIHILGGLVLFMTDGIVGAYAGFVYTYAVAPPMSLPNKMAGYLASIFWAAITAGRLVSIPLSYRFKPVYLLMFNLHCELSSPLSLESGSASELVLNRERQGEHQLRPPSACYTFNAPVAQNNPLCLSPTLAEAQHVAYMQYASAQGEADYIFGHTQSLRKRSQQQQQQQQQQQAWALSGPAWIPAHHAPLPLMDSSSHGSTSPQPGCIRA